MNLFTDVKPHENCTCKKSFTTNGSDKTMDIFSIKWKRLQKSLSSSICVNAAMPFWNVTFNNK